ncbi:MAG: flagellar motor switch protein FliN, partial [Planctomycetota bacterium]|nr:flagellar motor switch protein FliN [Planctomycetota bacterium]
EKSDDVEELMKLLGVDPEKVETPAPDPAGAPTEAVPPEVPVEGAPVPEGETPVAGEPAATPEVPELPQASPVFESFAPNTGQGSASIEMLRDVNLQVKVVLGRSQMFVNEVLRFSPGSVVELDKLTGDPLDVFVNDRLVARGEVLVINENFAIRITEVINPGRVNEE